MLDYILKDIKDKHNFIYSTKLLKNNKLYLCELYAVVGDGDHGVTIERIAGCIEKRISQNIDGDTIILF